MLINFSQKKTCYKCKALCQNRSSYSCNLGYGLNMLDLKIYPTEPCPKPTTVNDLIECMKHYRK